MDNKLAIKLLGLALNWDTEQGNEALNKLEYIAAAKYDGYRNFDAGNRFLESFILWLRQFNDLNQRKCAYKFVTERMLYFSEVQMDHLVSLLYRQLVFPIWSQQTCEIEKIPSYRIHQICNTVTFKILRRKTLFLGMSDGARLDAFRRKNVLSHEQVCISYELSKEKCESIHEAFEEWMKYHKYYNSAPKVENIFLIDDFSGSGNSILRFKDDNAEKPKGKLNKFIENYLGKYLKNDQKCKIYIVTYVATELALSRLRENIELYKKSLKTQNIEAIEMLNPLQLLENYIMVTPDKDFEFSQILEAYYDSKLEDEITKSGGSDLKYGYSQCALPLVLNHNCPNNSVYLLWGQTENEGERPGLKALFPRISRHEEGR